MGHLDEHTIDVFVLNPILLDEQTREATAHHLAECQACAALAEFLRSFYWHLEGAHNARESLSAHQQRVLQSLIPVVPTTRLLPFTPPPNVLPLVGNEFLTVLAAKSTPGTPTARFETVATMASGTSGLLVRVVLDTHTGMFKAYLHADDPSQREAVLLTFPRIHITLLLDERGQGEFALSGGEQGVDWPTMEAIVRIPVGYGVVLTEKLQKEGVSSHVITGLGGHYNVHLVRDGEALAFSVSHHAMGPVRSAMIMYPKPAPSVMMELQDEKGRLSSVNLPRALVIRLYL